ncbi:MAG: hypothetical protein IJJ64_08115 [Butyrivibrio sp.]|nr:hypothetical protein [Butyrivibrio sp.]
MRVETMLKEYHKMKKELSLLTFQIERFEGLTEDDVIEMMYFQNHNDCERVQTSNISEKTATIAMKYKEVMDRENSEWLHYLIDRYWELKDEIDFFEAIVEMLPDKLSALMKGFLYEEKTWDQMEGELHYSRRTIGNFRREAIRILNESYRIRDNAECEYMCT